MYVDNIEIFRSEDFLHFGKRPRAQVHPGNRPGAGDGERPSYTDYFFVQVRFPAFGTGSDNLDLVAQSGQLLLEVRYVRHHSAGISIIIRRNLGNLHRYQDCRVKLTSFTMYSSTMRWASSSLHWIGGDFMK